MVLDNLNLPVKEGGFFGKYKSTNSSLVITSTLSVALLDHEGEHVGKNGRADPRNEDQRVVVGHKEGLAQDDDSLEDGKD